MSKDYSSIYTIKELFDKSLPLYFDKDELELSTVGALGMFIDVNSSVIEDMVNITGRYISEIMPGQAELPDFIRAQAANYGLNNILASPAKMSMLLLVKESDVTDNATNVDDHLEFTLDADMSILIDDVNFSLPYDVKIRSTLYNGEYNHMAYYDENYTNDVVNETVPFIKTMKTIINGDVWLVLRVNVYQYKRSKTPHPITTNSILNIPYVDISFSDQLCNFEVFYTAPGSQTQIQLIKKADRQQPITSPFVFYKFTDNNTLRLLFANDDRYWVPEYNSNIIIYTYESIGLKGNIPFSKEGLEVYITGNTENEQISYNRNIFPMGLTQGNSVGGKDQLTLDDLKVLTSEKQVTVNSYTTDNDLNSYFNSFISIYEHNAVFVKQRDDYAGREYGCFIRLSDGTDIIPTNTVNIRITPEDVDYEIKSLRQYIIKPGTRFVYEDDTDTNIVVRKKDDTRDYDIEYFIAPLTIITTKPNKVNYYMNSIDKNVDVDYTYFNINSIFNFVVTECNIKRDSINGDNDYTINLKLARVDGVFNDLESNDFELQSNNGVIDTDRLEVLIIFDTNVGDYIRMTLVEDEESSDYIYNFTTKISTNDSITDNRILITNLLKRQDNTMDERLIDMVNPGMKIAVFYNYNDSKTSHEYSDISIVENHMLCNTYSPRDGEFYFAYPLDLIRSHVMFEDNYDTDLGYNFYLKQVPLFGIGLLDNKNTTISNVLNDIVSEHAFLSNTVDSLHGLFTINMKFYNTYGRARNFHIGYGSGESLLNHVNCTFDVGIKFFDGIITSDYVDLIKSYIKNYFESVNSISTNTNQAFISVLEYELHKNFEDQIRYSIFYSLNGYDSKYQIIENNNTVDSTSTNPDYIPEFLTLTTNDISINVL